MDLNMRSAYERSVTELEEAEAQLQDAQARVDELRAIRDGLQLALERYGKPLEEQEAAVEQPTIERSQAAEVSPRRTSSRRRRKAKGKLVVRQTDLALTALSELGDPSSTRAVLDWVTATGAKSAKGEPFTYDQIRGALTWLLETKRVTRPAPATWALPTQGAPSQDDFTPAADTAGVSTTGENGHSTQSYVLTRADLAPQPVGQVAS